MGWLLVMLPASWVAVMSVVLAPSSAPTLLPARPPRSARLAAPPRLALPVDDQPLAPRDELKSRFSRGEDEQPKTSFAPDVKPSAAEVTPKPASPNAQLLAEIRSIQKEPLPPRPEKKNEVDLNGIQPKFLLLGAVTYLTFSCFAWKFTSGAAEYFAANPFESSFYVVQRLTSIARVVVVSLGSLGTGITGFAALGQLALAVQVADGIRKGELDPNAVRIDPYGGRKKGELEMMFGFILGDSQLDKAGTRPGETDSSKGADASK